MKVRDSDTYELIGAELRIARKPWPCDVHGCGETIAVGKPYAHLSHGLKWCAKHLTYVETTA